MHPTGSRSSWAGTRARGLPAPQSRAGVGGRARRCRAAPSAPAWPVRRPLRPEYNGRVPQRACHGRGCGAQGGAVPRSTCRMHSLAASVDRQPRGRRAAGGGAVAPPALGLPGALRPAVLPGICARRGFLAGRSRPARIRARDRRFRAGAKGVARHCRSGARPGCAARRPMPARFSPGLAANRRGLRHCVVCLANMPLCG